MALLVVGLLAFSSVLLADGPTRPAATQGDRPAVAGAAAALAKIEWSAKDVAGKDVKVPAADRPTVLLFAQADQPQSQQAIVKAKVVLSAAASGQPETAPAAPAAQPQVVLVLTGAQADAFAAKLTKDGSWSWLIVIDKDYAASGRSSVHVWPTTVVVSAKGEPLAHLAGLPASYSKELELHLAFASGKIDKSELDKQLSGQRVVVDTSAQMAGRHLQVAERLIVKGLVAQAREELTKGLQLRPGDPALRIAMVRVLVLAGEPEEALAALEKLDEAAVPAWQVALWRGRVLMALGKWDQARVVLSGATRLNPEPAEAYYAIGLVYQHQADWQRAAEAFRLAFESTAAGREAAPAAPAPVPGRPETTETQPAKAPSDP